MKIRPCPIVFTSFSCGAKAYTLKALQIINGKSETHNMDDYQLVEDCISGNIYDSSPVDFTSDMGIRFILHPSVSKVSHPPRFASWIANSIASGLDSLFLSIFESQRQSIGEHFTPPLFHISFFVQKMMILLLLKLFQIFSVD